jgi:eukaryotic-like serine/threonine-protein kinase
MQGNGNTFMSDWSSDGRLLMFSGSTVRNLYTLEMSARGPARPTALFQSPRGIPTLGHFFPAVSGPPPWFTYMSNESGADEVYVQAMPGEQPGKWQVSNGGGTAPLWRRDGRELFYVAPDNTIVAVDVRTAPAFQLGAPHPLFKGPGRLPGAGTYVYDVSADGQKFLLVSPSESAIDSPIEVVLNWQEMLKKGAAR